MKKTKYYAVIGKNFGDEGKGLAVDRLASGAPGKVLGVRHNGGAQSGHTVEYPDKRFVFHQLSAVSFCQGDTLWAPGYYPDLYKLGEEVEAFGGLTGFVPSIFAHADACVTLIDDVLLNMAAEESRGAARHGSCGMGIYEAQCRSEAGFSITVGKLASMTQAQLVKAMAWIRREYLPVRLQELGLSGNVPGEYGELLCNAQVLENAAAQMLENIRYVQLVQDAAGLMERYDRVIFENGQGLLLDSENQQYSPHVTASRTGLINPGALVPEGLDRVVYVSRSYVTRHGAGPLPHECPPEALGVREPDITNPENPWQGRLRYARHPEPAEFAAAVQADVRELTLRTGRRPEVALLLTHLNETDHKISTVCGDFSPEQWLAMPPLRDTFDRCDLSDSRFGADVRQMIPVGAVAAVETEER